MGLKEKIVKLKETEWTWNFQNDIVNAILENKTDNGILTDTKQIIDELNAFIDELEEIIGDCEEE